MLHVNRLKDVLGITAMDRLEIERHQTYLREQQTRFDESIEVWSRAYQLSSDEDSPFLRPDFYISLITSDYQDSFYVTQYYQAIQWLNAGLTQSKVLLIFSQIRKILSAFADQIGSHNLSIGLNHVVDVAQAVTFTVFSVSEAVGRMKVRSDNEVRRLKNSYRLIAVDVPNDILQAYIDHHEWKILVFELSLGHHSEFEGFARSHEHCHLAHWLKKGGLEKIPLAQRATFLEAHERVHQLGSLAIDEFEARRPENITELLVEMEVASETVMEVLLNLIDEEFVKAANSDALTGLYNRRAFDLEFEKTLAFAKRHDFWLNFVILDIDLFKGVNDEFGHIVGDKVLNQMGAILKEVARTEDMLFRWGGEEFVVITLDKEDDGAYLLAERIRKAVAAAEFVNENGIQLKLTVSCGAVSYWAGLNLPTHEVFAAADKMLYQAKEAGRNRVCHFVLDVPVVKPA